MRSTLIVATLALSALAVPVPQSQLTQGTEVHGCFRSNSPRNSGVETRSPEQKQRACKITHPRDVQNNEARAIRNEGLSHGAKPKKSNGKREPIYRAGGRRDVQDEDDAEARAIRDLGKRSVREKTISGDIDARTVRPVKNQKRADEDEDEDEIEARAIRNEGKRSVREKTVSGDIDARTVRPVKNQKRSDEDIEARTVRPVKNQKRADEEDDEDEDIEARATKDMSERSVREKTVSDDGIEERGVVRPGSNGAVCLPGHVSSKCGFNKRTANTDQDLVVAEARDVSQRNAEAEPLSRNHGSYRRSAEAEAEPISRNVGSYRRSAEAEAEPISRNHGSYRRSAEAEPISRNHGSYRRSAEAEPISRNHGSYRRSAEAEPISRNIGSYRRSEEDAIDDIATEVEVDEQLSERSAKPQLSGRASTGRRDAEAGITRGDLSYRSASAEPAVTHSNQKTGNCHPGLLGSHC